MYYLIRHLSSRDCYVIECGTLKELAKELAGFDDGKSIIAGELSETEKHDLCRLQIENRKDDNWRGK